MAVDTGGGLLRPDGPPLTAQARELMSARAQGSDWPARETCCAIALHHRPERERTDDVGEAIRGVAGDDDARRRSNLNTALP
jgi:hypothetical protein